jgi:hypothetical protein
MPTLTRSRLLAIGASLLFILAQSASALTPSEIRARVQLAVHDYHWVSTDPKIVEAVRAYNANKPAAAQAMTDEKWKSLPLLDEFVRALSKNPLAEYLKSKKTPVTAELFVNGADGTKVAILNKPTNWSHKGKEKHEVPMTGKTWIGTPEVDQSTGTEEVQAGLPVLDNGKPIGSVIIGFQVR